MINIDCLPAFLTIIFSLFVFLYTYSYLSDTNITINKRIILIIIIISILIYLNNSYNEVYFRIPVAFGILNAYFYLIVKKSVYENLIISFCISIISLLVEFILSIIVSLVVSDIYVINENFLQKNCFSIICFWNYYFVSRIPIIKNFYKKILLVFENSKNYVISIGTFLVIIYFLYTAYALNYNNIQLYVFSILIIMFISIIVIYYFKELHNNSILNIKNKYLIDNQVMYKSLIEDFKMTKHNILNDFLFISTLCNDKTKEIIKEKIRKYNFNSCDFNFFDNLPEGLQGILYFKGSIAQKKNIYFYLDNSVQVEKQNLNNKLYIDLCEVISITLDNAIEASSLASSKVIYISIKDDENNIYVEILNTYSNDIDLDNIGNKDYSTKKIKSGLGLYYIKKLNKSIEIKTSFIFDLFKIQIIAKK